MSSFRRPGTQKLSVSQITVHLMAAGPALKVHSPTATGLGPSTDVLTYNPDTRLSATYPATHQFVKARDNG